MVPWLKLIALLRVVFPLPTWSDSESFAAWWTGLGPAVQEILATFVEQAKDGRLSLEMLDGSEFILANSECACASLPDDLEDKLVKLSGAWGDGKFLAILAKLLPILIQVLPIFLEPAPEPEPEPAPTPDVI